MTTQQTLNALIENKYISLRLNNGISINVNSKIVLLGFSKRGLIKGTDNKSAFMSFRPITLNEYISDKHPYK